MFTGSKDSIARLEKKSRNRSVYRYVVVVGGCGKCKEVGARLRALSTEEVELDGPECGVERYGHGEDMPKQVCLWGEQMNAGKSSCAFHVITRLL